MGEPNICIFRLSKKEEFPGGIEEVVKWIEAKSEGKSKYHFRKKKPRALPVGSIVLFSIEGKIIGEGIVKKSVRPTPSSVRKQLRQEDGYDYPYYLMFKPSSLTVYGRFPNSIEVERKTRRRFSRLFTYITKEEYRSILEMADSSLIEKDRTKNLLGIGAMLEKQKFDAMEEEIEPDVKSLPTENVKEVIANRDAQNIKQVGLKKDQAGKTYRRDPVLSSLLKRIHRDTCQVKTCRINLRVDRGFFTETHHIIPLNKRGKDTSTNILILCPNHHKLLDRSEVRVIKRTKSEITLEVGGKRIQVNVKLPNT